MKILLSLLLSALLISSCRTYSYIDDYSIAPNEQLLPKLSVVTDQEIFHKSQQSEYYDSYSRSIGTAANRHMIERQFTSYILDQLSNSKVEKEGYAVMRINHMKVRNNIPLLSLLAIVSAGASTVMGIPAGQYVVELDLTVEILDNKQNILGTYRGRGKQKALIAMYYGYGEREAKEKCLYESIEQCLNQINEKIMNDMDYLGKSLKDQ